MEGHSSEGETFRGQVASRERPYPGVMPLSQLRQAPASWDPRERRPAGTSLPEIRWPAGDLSAPRGHVSLRWARRLLCGGAGVLSGFPGFGLQVLPLICTRSGGWRVQPVPCLPSQEHRKAFQLMWLGFLKHKVGRVGAAAAGSGPLARAVGGVGQAAPRPAPPPSCPSACARRC